MPSLRTRVAARYDAVKWDCRRPLSTASFDAFLVMMVCRQVEVEARWEESEDEDDSGWGLRGT